MSSLRFAPGVFMMLAVMAAPLAASAQAEPLPVVEAAGDRDGVFRYPLRQNESLNEVSRIFGVPVAELIELNRIGDPNRLRTGQVIEIPDFYAREAAALRAERDTLLREKTEANREIAGRQQAITGLADKITELEREKEALEWQIAATGHWERGAKLAGVIVLGLLAWALKLLSERSNLSRRLRVVAAENSVLATAKEKYRDAAGQMELRFQQLYSGRHTAPKEIIADGTARIKRAFADGAVEIERQITTVKLEREKEEQVLDAEHKMLSWLTHPLREVLARTRS